MSSHQGTLHSQSTRELVNRLAGIKGKGRFITDLRIQIGLELKNRPEHEVKEAEARLTTATAKR